MIEEITVHDADAAQGEAKREHQTKLAAWKAQQLRVLAGLHGLTHKVGEEYDPHQSQVLAYMVKNLDPLFLAEQALIGLARINATKRLEFNRDTRTWSCISEVEQQEKRAVREAKRAEEIRLRKERKALRAAGQIVKTGRGRVSNLGPAELAAWWILFHEEKGTLPAVGKLHAFINDSVGQKINNRGFFRLWKRTQKAGVLTATVDPTDVRRSLIGPGPKWADAGLDLPMNWQTPDRASLLQLAQPEEIFI